MGHIKSSEHFAKSACSICIPCTCMIINQKMIITTNGSLKDFLMEYTLQIEG